MEPYDSRAAMLPVSPSFRRFSAVSKASLPGLTGSEASVRSCPIFAPLATEASMSSLERFSRCTLACCPAALLSGKALKFPLSKTSGSAVAPWGDVLRGPAATASTEATGS